MDDAGGTRLPYPAHVCCPAPSRLQHRLAAGAWIPFFSWPRHLRDAAVWQPDYGWILGAGVTCLGAAWLLSRLGARHEMTTRGLAPPRSPKSAASAPPAARSPGAASARDRATTPALARTPARRSGEPSSIRSPRRHGRLGFVAPRRPSNTTAGLHLVSGSTPALTANRAGAWASASRACCRCSAWCNTPDSPGSTCWRAVPSRR